MSGQQTAELHVFFFFFRKKKEIIINRACIICTHDTMIFILRHQDIFCFIYKVLEISKQFGYSNIRCVWIII